METDPEQQSQDPIALLAEYTDDGFSISVASVIGVTILGLFVTQEFSDLTLIGLITLINGFFVLSLGTVVTTQYTVWSVREVIIYRSQMPSSLKKIVVRLYRSIDLIAKLIAVPYFAYSVAQFFLQPSLGLISPIYAVFGSVLWIVGLFVLARYVLLNIESNHNSKLFQSEK